MAFATLVYTTDGAIATITLNRPEYLNTIVPPMPEEFEAADPSGRQGPVRQSHHPARRRARVLRRL